MQSSRPRLYPARRAAQRGALSGRTLAILAVLLVLLSLPFWYKPTVRPGPDPAPPMPQATRDAAEAAARAAAAAASAAAKVSAVEAAEAAQAAGQTPSNAIAMAVNHYGMTWGFMPQPDATSGAVWASCHGEPRSRLDQAHQGSCNPYRGDTTCRATLPVLCVRPEGGKPPAGLAVGSHISPGQAVTDGWVGGAVASTAPLAGFLLESLAVANERCEKELGAGWRMAEFHDGQGGWGFLAYRDGRLNTASRHWVHINDQRGNCWNTP